jgi:hypothetical protein
MGWSIGYDNNLERDIGYSVPALCDHPECNEEIDRGLSYVCGGEAFGGEHGCGMHFCPDHLTYAGEARDGVQLCTRCRYGKKAYTPKPDVPKWIRWKLNDKSWQQWRDENPDEVVKMKAYLESLKAKALCVPA